MPKTPDTEQTTTPQKEIVYVQAPYPYPPEEDEINLLDLWRVIWRRHRKQTEPCYHF